MRKPAIQQKTERRISAALRLAMVAILLLTQVVLVSVLSHVLWQKFFYAYALLEGVAVLCALRIYNRPGDATYKPGWILLVLVVPVVGMMLYFLWSGDRPEKRLDLKNIPRPQESDQQKAASRERVECLRKSDPTWGRLAAYLDRHGYGLYENTEVTYLPTGEQYLVDLLTNLQKAEHFILLEYYIAGQGQVWDSLTDILERKAADGVEIKLILDDFGSMLRLPPEEIDRLGEMGIEVRLFNPVHHYVNRLYFNYRDHRKIAVIDGNKVYTGGVNLADEYANLVERFGYWKDGGVRLEGQGAWGLTREFIYLWERLGGEMDQDHDAYRPTAVPTAQGCCQAISDGPDNNPVDTAEDAFLQLIAGGRERVYITSPYLAIDETMVRALCIAGDSGVDVRLMMPGIPDHPVAFCVAESYFGVLLRHHVKIYRYEPGFLHAKMVMADGEAAFVGTVNMDYRSLRLHFECGVLLYHLSAIGAIQADMEEITAHSHQLDYAEWKSRPGWQKMLGAVLKPFASWM